MKKGKQNGSLLFTPRLQRKKVQLTPPLTKKKGAVGPDLLNLLTPLMTAHSWLEGKRLGQYQHKPASNHIFYFGLHLNLPHQSPPYQNIPYPSLPYQNIPYPSLPYQNIPYLSLPYQNIPYLSLPEGPALRLSAFYYYYRLVSKRSQGKSISKEVP